MGNRQYGYLKLKMLLRTQSNQKALLVGISNPNLRLLGRRKIKANGSANHTNSKRYY